MVSTDIDAAIYIFLENLSWSQQLFIRHSFIALAGAHNDFLSDIRFFTYTNIPGRTSLTI